MENGLKQCPLCKKPFNPDETKCSFCTDPILSKATLEETKMGSDSKTESGKMRNVIGNIASVFYVFGIVGYARTLITADVVDPSIYGIILASFIIALICKKPFLPMLGSWIIGLYLICFGSLGKKVATILPGISSGDADFLAFSFLMKIIIGFIICLFALVATIVFLRKRK